jgi:hypothetical protein
MENIEIRQNKSFTNHYYDGKIIYDIIFTRIF